MITSIPIEAIEKQLLQQLSSFFFLSEEDEMLKNREKLYIVHFDKG